MKREEIKKLLAKIRELNDDEATLSIMELAADSMALEQLKSLQGIIPSKESKAEISSEEDKMIINFKGISISSKARADGRFQGYVIENDGKRRYFYGDSVKEVERKIQNYKNSFAPTKKRKAVNKVVEIEKETDDSPTFNDFADFWIKTYKAPNLKPRSLLTVKSSINTAKKSFGKKRMGEISTDDVQTMLIGMKQGRTRDLCKQYVNQIFDKAMTRRIIKENPCDGVEIKKHSSKHKPALTRTEQQQFLAKLDSIDSKHSLLFRFLLSTGLRIGEALALTKNDVDFDKHTVHVCKDVVFIKDKRIVQTPKSATSYRTVPIPTAICEQLKGVKTKLLFPVTYNAVNKSIQRLRKVLGFNFTIHTLRHTYATRLEEAQISPKIKQKLLGHSSLEMTQNVYTDTQQEYLESMSESVRNVFEAV
ncbi:MAG: tyrosine-type recombinase/integrase [Clostridia bacterium]|nr:tyrosine-type recombinase/integrase [Clostridia bacterium]